MLRKDQMELFKIVNYYQKRQEKGGEKEQRTNTVTRKQLLTW